MFYQRTLLTEYPYKGVFYTTEVTEQPDGSIIDTDRDMDDIVFDDADLDPDAGSGQAGEGEEEIVENIVLEVDCDIQQSAKMFSNGAIIGDYDVFFAVAENDEGKLYELPIRGGMMFRSEGFPIPITGMIVGIAPTQMGVKVEIKMSQV
ncbi:MAG: hypothetical protein HUK08_05315 [Bacteroidaceae bacterium]|nr:hypothetical protein [Bacteroidaceae bacterium]